MNKTKQNADRSACDLPSTVNFHFIRSCNGRCAYCFAGFEKGRVSKLPTADLLEIIRQIAAVPLPESSQMAARKLNFVGGEPTLASDLPFLVATAKGAGMTTSIVTNGYKLIQDGVDIFSGMLDLLGVSIDSLNPFVNRRIGRVFNEEVITDTQWIHLLNDARRKGIAVKINTVVNRYNVDENLSSFIREIDPIRWKIFHALPVEGQNQAGWCSLEISKIEFNQFVTRHRHLDASGIPVIAEDNDLMRGSYAMISPDGRFFDTVTGQDRYSDPILEVGVEKAFSQIDFSAGKYNRRNGEYSILNKNAA